MNEAKNIVSRTLIGSMDDRITIRQFTTSTGGLYGDDTGAFSDLATVWAYTEYLDRGTNESESAEQITVFQTLAFTIRYRSDLNENMKIRFQNRDYDIATIAVLGRKQHLRIETKLRK